MSLDAIIFILAVIYWVFSSILGHRKKKAQKEAMKRQEAAPAPAASATHTDDGSPSNLETVSRIAKALGIYVPEEISPLPPPSYYEPESEEEEKPKPRLKVVTKKGLSPKEPAQGKNKTDRYSVKREKRRPGLSLAQLKQGLNSPSEVRKAVIFKTILDSPPSVYKRRFTH